MTQWSSYQQAVFEAVEQRAHNLAVEAVAGSGKTTTIVEAAKRLKGSAYLAAFNKKMGDELSAKVQGMPGKQAGTFHSVGYKALSGRYGPLSVKGKKISEAWYEQAGKDERLGALGPAVVKLVSLAKQSALGLQGWISAEEWDGLIEHFGVLDDAPEGVTGEELAGHAERMLTWSTDAAREGLVDFDDMLYVPLKDRLRVMRFNTIFVDEAQDTNTARRLVTQAMCWPESRVVAVGDPCQPTGTHVAVVRQRARGTQRAQVEQVKIEDLQIGDRVLSYQLSDSAFVYGREVLGKSKRDFHGQLVRVSAGKYASQYTPNHHCVANFKPLEAHYAVYLMQRGECFRIGLTRMGHREVIGPQARLRAEGGQALWILSVFEQRKTAALYEAKVAARYGLPMLMFTAKNNSVFSQQELDTFWAMQAREGSTQMREGAEQALAEHYREFAYPMFTGKAYQVQIRRPTVVHACNLLDGCVMLPFTGKCHTTKQDWVPIRLSYQRYDGAVYSLTVEGEHLYVGDGLVTHNCQAIYGFSGAGASAMDDMIAHFDMQELPLSICYRCSQAVVREAQYYLPTIEAHADAPEGQVSHAMLRELLQLRPQPTEALLCRFNRPLVRVAFELIKLGVPVRIEGRDIGEGLIALSKKWPGIRSLSTLSEKLAEWADREQRKHVAKKRFSQAQAVADKLAVMGVFIDRTREQHGGMAELQALIREMFQDSAGQARKVFTLSSVHKAKGLEWPRVLVLGKGEVMPSPYATQPWELQQEQNLVYVAVTRAAHELVYVSGVEEEVEKA